MTLPPRAAIASLPGLALALSGLVSCAGRSPAPPVLANGVPCPACPAPPARTCPPPPDRRLAGLPARIDTALWLSLDSLTDADFTPSGGILGAAVFRVRDTGLVWSRHPDTRLLPASTQKVFTAAVAMSELGGGFRWRTTLWSTGTKTDSGLVGDLVLEGGGDPTLGSADGAGMGTFAAAVAKLGLKTIHGNLVALDTIAGRGLDAWPGGWTLSSAHDGYGAPVVGLNWNQNRIGDRALPEPRPEALKALRKALLSKGIKVTGTDTTVKVRGDSLPSRKSMARLATISSPDLDAVLRVCLRESVNPFAEATLVALGLARRGNPREAGRKRIQEWLGSHGMDPTHVTIDDGSGLSRYDQVSARQMAKLLARDVQSPKGRLMQFLPRGGEGTLRSRVKMFPDRTVLSAKTGTLDGVSNLAGYLVRPGRDTLVFSFLCNGFSGGAKPVRLFQDRLLATISGIRLSPVTASDTLDSLARPTPDSSKAPVSVQPAVSAPVVGPPAMSPPPVVPAKAPAPVAPAPSNRPDTLVPSAPAGKDSIQDPLEDFPPTKTL